ncbi:hypothetical protein NO2_0300 [Candidatus Termititenax persephonae]|uniref:Uncharacterized protein n=1 Tax=Candidatus Termititenax persephonae TaxID=2218525 RepID=A0A388TF20_9BACT|nr:hypothetical protein NO2_0300 [Candidatus Termititenax persephonae]
MHVVPLIDNHTISQKNSSLRQYTPANPNIVSPEEHDYFKPKPASLETILSPVRYTLPLPGFRTLPDIIPETASPAKPNQPQNILLSVDGQQIRGVYCAEATQPLTIETPADTRQKNLSECFTAALRGETTSVVIGGLYFDLTYDTAVGQFSLANDDTVYHLPLGPVEQKPPLSESQNITAQNIGYTVDNAPKQGFEILKSIISAIKDHPDGDAAAILSDVLDGLKTIGKDRAIDLLNDLYSAQKNNPIDIIFQRRISAIIYDAIYALETLVYKDKLAADKAEFQVAAADIDVIGQTRKLMEIQQRWQQEIDKLPNVSKREPQQKLLHTKLLNEFLLKTFIEEIFLPDLFDKYPRLENSMFMFGFGRLLSENNKLGASAGSDMDSNVIVGSGQGTGSIICENEADVETIKQELKIAQEVLDAYLHLNMEIDDEFTVRSFDEFEESISPEGKNLENDPEKSTQFYISILRDYYQFHEPNERIILDFHNAINISAKKFDISSPIQAIFEENLNDSSKYSIGMAHGDDPLPLGNKRYTDKVIGSGNEQPDNWYFSMKYTVNRFYDFLYKLESLKGTPDEVSLSAVGLSEKDALFIKNVNNMMLALQNYALKLHPENCGYLSAADFQELYARPEFRQEFKIIAEKLSIQPGLLEKISSSFNQDYRKLGHTFFKRLDEKMFGLHQKIAAADALKNH